MHAEGNILMGYRKYDWKVRPLNANGRKNIRLHKHFKECKTLGRKDRSGGPIRNCRVYGQMRPYDRGKWPRELEVWYIKMLIHVFVFPREINFDSWTKSLNIWRCSLFHTNYYLLSPLKTNLWLTTPKGATGRWQHEGIMWLALRFVKLINVNFLNQIRYSSIQ